MAIEKRTLVIWGAGRIGRGFVADIFQSPDWEIVFVDVDQALVDALNARKGYTIFKMTSDGVFKTRIEGGFTAVHTSDAARLEEIFSRDDLMLDIAVHAPKLGEVADMLTPLFVLRAKVGKRMDAMMNVNMTLPDEAFTALMEERLTGEDLTFFRENVGVTGIAAMCISPMAEESQFAEDPLALQNNGYHEQAIDKGRLKCAAPILPRLRLCDDVTREETRKLFTLNMLHASACYMGLQLGLETSYDAANCPKLRKVLESALVEASYGLSREFGFGHEEMAEWRQTVMKLLENPYIKDGLQRLGADSRRKLGPNDRLLGPARLCLKYGGRPESLCQAIRAGFDYVNDDEGTRWVRSLVEKNGLKAAVMQASGLSDGDMLLDMILESELIGG